MLNERRRAVAACTLGAVIIAFAPIAVRESEVGPQATAFWRMAFAALPLFLMAALDQARAPKPIPWRFLITGGVFLGLDFVLWHLSLKMTTIANSTLLSNMTPLVAVAAAILFLREKLRAHFIIGAAIALLGAGLLSFGRATQSDGGQSQLLGDALALATALMYGSYLFLVRLKGMAAGVFTVMAVTTGAATIVTAAATLAAGEAFFPQSAKGWLILGGLGLIVHVVGQGLIAFGVARLPMQMSTVLLWIQPIVVALLGYVLYQEGLGPAGFAGAALLLAGVYIVQRARA